MVRVGIIGLGFMGRTHYEAYQKIEGAQVVAIADADAKRASGDLGGTAGNVATGGLGNLPMDKIKGTTNYRELINMKEVDLVDICVPTPDHAPLAVEALTAGKHVIGEKPMARTSAQAKQIVDAAAKAKGFFMPAMCLRFWPEYEWLKKAVSEQTYGRALSVTFRRVASFPGGWFGNGEQSGGATLDLHVHDVDQVLDLFGKPKSVYSRGYAKGPGKIDHVITTYAFDKKDTPLVYAEGGWTLADGFGFTMRYTANFERATADFVFARPEGSLLLTENGKTEPVKLPDYMGYEGELRYLVDCIAKNKRPTRVTAEDGLAGIQIVEAELKSVETGQVVSL